MTGEDNDKSRHPGKQCPEVHPGETHLNWERRIGTPAARRSFEPAAKRELRRKRRSWRFWD